MKTAKREARLMLRLKSEYRRSIKALCAGVTFLLVPAEALPAQSNAPSRPNIILFLVDDMGVMDTSVPMLTDRDGTPERHPLNDRYRTPNMETLAGMGIRFSNFYAHSVCSPTRISILTGRNSSRHGTTNWIAPTENNRGTFDPPEWNWSGLDRNDFTLAHLLRRNGYRTIHIGKAHFGPRGHDGADPTNLGFDRNIGGNFTGHPASYYGEQNYGKGNLRAVPHLSKYHGTETHLTEALTREANREITEASKSRKPFFLYMSHYAVHAPFLSDPRFAEHYEDSGLSAMAQAYATMVEGIDKSLGDIITNLEQLGVADNTLLLFLGDNGSDAPLGDPHDYTSSSPLLGKKGTHHEGGIRVPFICAWVRPDPGNPWQQQLPIAAGKIHSQIGTITDLLPTICAMTGIDLPDDYQVDGFDLKKQLEGKYNPERANTFLNHFPHPHNSSYYTLFIQDHWKIVYHYPIENSARYELYNLEDDPCEKHNLAEEEPERLKTMILAMQADLQAKGALYPVKDGESLKPEVP